MNSTPATTATPLHESVRAGLSDNRDPSTGERTQVLSTSRLLMWWEAGDLRMRFDGASGSLALAAARGVA